MITVERLGYTYAGSTTPAITDLSFSVAPGEVFGFLGPSGSGKSTTQRVLTKLLADYTGSASVRGRELRDWNRDFYENIGVCFEYPNHYGKLSCAENLRYFGRLYSQPTREPGELLEQVGLAEEADTPASALSKGMKIRLNLARALLHRPDLLFLDEPTAGLDPVNVRRIKEVIRGEAETGATIFLTTHDMAVANDLCDRVAFLVDGCIGEVGSPRALRLAHGRRDVRVDLVDGRSLSFPLDGLADDPAFLAALRGGVQTIHTQEATLEDVFVQLTGRTLT